MSSLALAIGACALASRVVAQDLFETEKTFLAPHALTMQTVTEPLVAMLEWSMPFNLSAAETYRARTLDMLEPTRSEPGCLHFDVFEDVDAVSGLPKIWQYLIFQDETAHQAHMASEAVATWINATAGLIESSELTPLGMNTPTQRPVECLKQAATDPLVVLVRMYVNDAAQQEKLQKGMGEFMEHIRAEEGILYYDQLVPRQTGTRGGTSSYLLEVVWYTDKAAQEKHLAQDMVNNFLALFDPAPQFDLSLGGSLNQPLSKSTQSSVVFSLPPC